MPSIKVLNKKKISVIALNTTWITEPTNTSKALATGLTSST